MKLRLTAHLWTGGVAVPSEYLSYFLRTQVYHCSPEELKRIPLKTILHDLTCVGVENRVRGFR